MLEKMLNIAIHTNEPVEMLDAYFTFSLGSEYEHGLASTSSFNCPSMLAGLMRLVAYRVRHASSIYLENSRKENKC